jgi:hypothetical protein
MKNAPLPENKWGRASGGAGFISRIVPADHQYARAGRRSPFSSYSWVFMEVTTIAAVPPTGHLNSHMPQPMQRS